MDEIGYGFSDSFFEPGNTGNISEDEYYRNDISGESSDVDQGEIEEALYQQIHYEVVNSSPTQDKESVSTSACDKSKELGPSLPQPWEASTLTASQQLRTDTLTRENQRQAKCTPGAKKSVEKSTKKKRNTDAESPTKNKVTVDYEYECESRSEALSSKASKSDKRSLTPLAQFLVRNKVETASKVVSGNKRAKKKSSDPDAVIVISDSDYKSSPHKSSNPVIVIGTDDSDRDKTSDDSDEDSVVLLTEQDKKQETCDIHLNVVETEENKVVLDCENLVDWEDLNLTIEDVLNTQGDDGWAVIDQDKFGGTDYSRYYNKSKIVCNNCNERGHIAKACPKPPKPVVCIQCGFIGHRSFRCALKLCFNCERPGHSKLDCPHPRRSRFNDCHRCHYLGHAKWECPDEWRQYHITTKEGKMMKGDEGTNNKTYCYNCAQAGHLGYECEDVLMDEYKYPHYPFICRYETNTSVPEEGNQKKGDSFSHKDQQRSLSKGKKRKAPEYQETAAPSKRQRKSYAGNKKPQKQTNTKYTDPPSYNHGDEVLPKKNKKKKKKTFPPSEVRTHAQRSVAPDQYLSLKTSKRKEKKNQYWKQQKEEKKQTKHKRNAVSVDGNMQKTRSRKSQKNSYRPDVNHRDMQTSGGKRKKSKRGNVRGFKTLS